jgi:hypothetical protein
MRFECCPYSGSNSRLQLLKVFNGLWSQDDVEMHSGYIIARINSSSNHSDPAQSGWEPHVGKANPWNEASAVLCQQLLTDLTDIASADEAATRAQRILNAKNSLTWRAATRRRLRYLERQLNRPRLKSRRVETSRATSPSNAHGRPRRNFRSEQETTTVAINDEIGQATRSHSAGINVIRLVRTSGHSCSVWPWMIIFPKSCWLLINLLRTDPGA